MAPVNLSFWLIPGYSAAACRGRSLQLIYWGTDSHLRLPDNLITISSNFKRTKSSSNSDSKTNTAYYQDKHVLCADGARGRELHVVGWERRLEDHPQPLRRKTPDKGKLKATLPEVKTPEETWEVFKIQCNNIHAPCSEGRKDDENHVGYQ